MATITNFKNGEQSGAVSPPPSEPFRLPGKTQNYRVQLEANIDGGNVKASSITLEKEITTRSGKDYQGYATSYDGGKTWYEPGTKPLRKISTSTGLSADEIKSLQPGGALNKAVTGASQAVAKKSNASSLQQTQIKQGNDAVKDPNSEIPSDKQLNQFLNKENELFKTTTRQTYNDVKYPIGLNPQQQDCIKFSIVQYKPSGLKGFGESTAGSRIVEVESGKPSLSKGKDRTILGTITLPIPGGIQDSNTVNWSGLTMNPFEQAIGSIVSSELGQGKGTEKLNEQMQNAMKARDDLRKGIVSKFTESAISSAGGVMQRLSGNIINPNLELLFNSPDLRTFAFSFKLSPRSRDEAELIKQIIRNFKQAMSVKRSESSFLLQSPNTFAISYIFKNGPHPYLNRFKECALLSCNVNYTPEGNYMSFDDQDHPSMVSYQLDLTFQELEPIYDDDYGKDYNNIGF